MRAKSKPLSQHNLKVDRYRWDHRTPWGAAYAFLAPRMTAQSTVPTSLVALRRRLVRT